MNHANLGPSTARNVIGRGGPRGAVSSAKEYQPLVNRIRSRIRSLVKSVRSKSPLRSSTMPAKKSVSGRRTAGNVSISSEPRGDLKTGEKRNTVQLSELRSCGSGKNFKSRTVSAPYVHAQKLYSFGRAGGCAISPLITITSPARFAVYFASAATRLYISLRNTGLNGLLAQPSI